jgi:hypothetical protein
MRWLTLILALVLAPLAAAAQDGGRGTLTILVRDPAGTPLVGVTIALVHDTDLDGPVLITTTTTDDAGVIVQSELPWGLYLVQFQGTAPDGRPMLPADQQNMGVLTDGNGLSGGFGLRFAEAEATSLYVLGSVAGDGHAIPMFDMAASPADPPQPYDPIVALASAGPTPTPFLLRDVVEGRVDVAGRPIPRERFDGWCLIGFGLVLGAVALLFLAGWWRSRRTALMNRKEVRDAGLDGTSDPPGVVQPGTVDRPDDVGL